METIASKTAFLKYDYIKKLMDLDAHTAAAWGKMNVQQMIEHMSDYVCIASGKTVYALHTAEDRLPKMQGFLMSDKPFQENTPNPLMPDVPPMVRHVKKENAIAELEQELNYFFEVFNAHPNAKHMNPFFGELDYPMQIQLLHKHAMHHLRQFGVV
jgi:hypothetical protein